MVLKTEVTGTLRKNRKILFITFCFTLFVTTTVFVQNISLNIKTVFLDSNAIDSVQVSAFLNGQAVQVRPLQTQAGCVILATQASCTTEMWGGSPEPLFKSNILQGPF